MFKCQLLFFQLRNLNFSRICSFKRFIHWSVSFVRLRDLNVSRFCSIYIKMSVSFVRLRNLNVSQFCSINSLYLNVGWFCLVKRFKWLNWFN